MDTLQEAEVLGEIDQQAEEKFEQFWDDLAREVAADANQAQSTGATGMDSSPEESRAENGLANQTDSADAPKPLSLEDQVKQVRAIVNGKASHREILRKILAYCGEMRELGDVEQTVQEYPEFAYAAQNPYRLIIYLVDCGGLDKLDLDEEGAIVTDERKLGLSEDEIDDLVLTYGFKTTEAGRMVADELAPEKRIDKLLAHTPERFDTYIDLLDFCKEPKSMQAIDNLLGSRDLSRFTSLNTGSSVSIKPSVFVDKLERAGGIVWKDGWVLTEEGKAFLEKTVAERA